MDPYSTFNNDDHKAISDSLLPKQEENHSDKEKKLQQQATFSEQQNQETHLQQNKSQLFSQKVQNADEKIMEKMNKHEKRRYTILLQSMGISSYTPQNYEEVTSQAGIIDSKQKTYFQADQHQKDPVEQEEGQFQYIYQDGDNNVALKNLAIAKSQTLNVQQGKQDSIKAESSFRRVNRELGSLDKKDFNQAKYTALIEEVQIDSKNQLKQPQRIQNNIVLTSEIADSLHQQNKVLETNSQQNCKNQDKDNVEVDLDRNQSKSLELEFQPLAQNSNKRYNESQQHQVQKQQGVQKLQGQVMEDIQIQNKQKVEIEAIAEVPQKMEVEDQYISAQKNQQFNTQNSVFKQPTNLNSTNSGKNEIDLDFISKIYTPLSQKNTKQLESPNGPANKNVQNSEKRQTIQEAHKSFIESQKNKVVAVDEGVEASNVSVDGSPIQKLKQVNESEKISKKSSSSNAFSNALNCQLVMQRQKHQKNQNNQLEYSEPIIQMHPKTENTNNSQFLSNNLQNIPKSDRKRKDSENYKSIVLDGKTFKVPSSIKTMKYSSARKVFQPVQGESFENQDFNDIVSKQIEQIQVDDEKSKLVTHQKDSNQFSQRQLSGSSRSSRSSYRYNRFVDAVQPPELTILEVVHSKQNNEPKVQRKSLSNSHHSRSASTCRKSYDDLSQINMQKIDQNDYEEADDKSLKKTKSNHLKCQSLTFNNLNQKFLDQDENLRHVENDEKQSHDYFSSLKTVKQCFSQPTEKGQAELDGKHSENKNQIDQVIVNSETLERDIYLYTEKFGNQHKNNQPFEPSLPKIPERMEYSQQISQSFLIQNGTLNLKITPQKQQVQIQTQPLVSVSKPKQIHTQTSPKVKMQMDNQNIQIYHSNRDRNLNSSFSFSIKIQPQVDKRERFIQILGFCHDFIHNNHEKSLYEKEKLNNIIQENFKHYGLELNPISQIGEALYRDGLFVCAYIKYMVGSRGDNGMVQSFLYNLFNTTVKIYTNEYIFIQELKRVNEQRDIYFKNLVGDKLREKGEEKTSRLSTQVNLDLKVQGKSPVKKMKKSWLDQPSSGTQTAEQKDFSSDRLIRRTTMEVDKSPISILQQSQMSQKQSKSFKNQHLNKQNNLKNRHKKPTRKKIKSQNEDKEKSQSKPNIISNVQTEHIIHQKLQQKNIVSNTDVKTHHQKSSQKKQKETINCEDNSQSLNDSDSHAENLTESKLTSNQDETLSQYQVISIKKGLQSKYVSFQNGKNEQNAEQSKKRKNKKSKSKGILREKSKFKKSQTSKPTRVNTRFGGEKNIDYKKVQKSIDESKKPAKSKSKRPNRSSRKNTKSIAKKKQ